jgi:hypothetical protein
MVRMLPSLSSIRSVDDAAVLMWSPTCTGVPTAAVMGVGRACLTMVAVPESRVTFPMTSAVWAVRGNTSSRRARVRVRHRESLRSGVLKFVFIATSLQKSLTQSHKAAKDSCFLSKAVCQRQDVHVLVKGIQVLAVLDVVRVVAQIQIVEAEKQALHEIFVEDDA